MCCPTATRLRHNHLMPCESQQFLYFAHPAGTAEGSAKGARVFAQDCVNPVNLPPPRGFGAARAGGRGGGSSGWESAGRRHDQRPQKQMHQKQMPQKQMRAGIAAGPHCRRCWHSGFPAPELTASFRRSLPFGSHPSGRYSSSPLSLPVLPAGQALPSCSAFSPAASAVPDHMGLAVAGARATVFALPRFLPLRACFLVPSFRRRSLRPGLAASPSDVLPRGRQGPFRRSGVLPLASASAGRCPRSCDHRPCRFRFASGRRSGIRNRSFRSAFRPFQSAPQHAGTGFNAYFPVRSDWSISACYSVPCGSFLWPRFPLDKTDAAPRP